MAEGLERLKLVKSEMRLQGVPSADQGGTTNSDLSASLPEADSSNTRWHNWRSKAVELVKDLRTRVYALPGAVEAKAAPVASALRSRAAAAVDSAEAFRSRGLKACAADAVQEVTAAVHSFSLAARTKASSTVGALQSNVELVTGKAKGAAASAAARVAAVRGIVVATYQDIREKGAKTFVLTVAQDTKTLVQSLADRAYGGAAQAITDGKQTIYGSLSRTQEKAAEAAAFTKGKATELKASALETAGDGRFQATTASAVGGAVALGATGGATGLATGSMIGAAVGLVPAIFTFGLSIPVGAVIGGGAGLAIGTTVGGAVGALGGGSAGYSVYNKRDELKTGADKTWVKVRAGAGYVRVKAKESAGYVAERASVVRHRLSYGGTGGTESHD